MYLYVYFKNLKYIYILLFDQRFYFQIEDTKEKQIEGIQRILSTRFSTEQIDQCFSNPNANISTSTEFIKTGETSPSSQAVTEEVFVTNTTTTSATISTTTTSTTTTIITTTTTSRGAFSDDQATTPNPTLPTKCEAGEYQETREHYEVCASNKIREITAWLERRARRRNSSQKEEAEEEKKSILTVCNAVRQLLYDCGNELGWCFTEDQVRIISNLDIFQNIWFLFN